MTPMTGFSVKEESALRFLRLAEGIDRETLGGEVGVEPCAIQTFEEGCRWLPLCDAASLSDFFAVGCSTLLNDDMREAAAAVTHPIRWSGQQQKNRNRIRQTYRERIGGEGEAWVAQMERDKLMGTPYANAVNPNYANEPECHFDILSFTPEGECIYIEVKSTAGGDDAPFFMTSAELRFLRRCINEGKRYELHRVIYATKPNLRRRLIYTAREVLEQFELLPSSYLLGKRLEAVG